MIYQILHVKKTISMKSLIYLFIITHFCTALYAIAPKDLEIKANQGDAQSAYNLAEYYENKGEPELALAWYKKASSIALGRSSKALENSLVKSKVDKIERTQEVYASILTPYANDPKTLSTVEQMMTKTFDLSAYKTNYVLPATYDFNDHDDRNNFETKFQISFQKSLLDNFFGLDETFALGYTQTSWWQTGESSTPFRETNYQPEFFLVIPHFDKESFIKAYQFGLLHESNGQDVPKSRSWNRLYAKAYLQLGEFLVAPRVWYRIPEEAGDDDNPDIEEYLGHGDMEITYPWGGHTFKFLVRHNLHFDKTSKGALQTDWSFPLWDDTLFGYIQIYSGYAESLIDYNKKTNRISLGFALSR